MYYTLYTRFILCSVLVFCFISNCTAANSVLSEPASFAASSATPLPSPAATSKKEKQALRIELEIADSDIPYAVLPLGELGVCVVMTQNELGSKKPKRPVIFFDQNLDRRWVSPLNIESEYQFVSYRLSSDSLHFALTNLPNTKSDYPFIQISICLADGAWKKSYMKISIPQKPEILSMKMLDDYWFFLGKTKDQYLWYKLPLNPLDNNSYSLTYTNITNKDFEDWCNIYVDTASSMVYSLFRDSKLKSNSLLLCSHNINGDFLTYTEIKSTGGDLRLVDGQIHLGSPGNLWIAGTFNLGREKQTLSSYDRGSQGIGVFTCLLKNGQLSSFWNKSYYNFDNIDSLMSKDALFTYKQSMEKAKGRTLIPAFISQIRLSNHSSGGFYLLSEVYERIETTSTEMYYDYYGRMVPYTRSYFEGFKYKDAFYVVFDSNGNEQYNRIFDIDRNKNYQQLTPYTHWIEDDTSKQLLYTFPYDDFIAFRNIDSASKASYSSQIHLLGLYSQDKVQRVWGTSITHWYGSSFLAFGQQQIWNNRYQGKSRRNVFYLQKVISEK